MKLWIFTTRKDLSLSRIEDEANNASIQCETVYYETLSLHEGALKASGKPIVVSQNERIIIRWPFDADSTEVEYNIFVHFLLFHYEKQIVFDRKCLRLFTPYYEDKLFQSFVFQKLSVPTPKTLHIPSFDRKLKQTISFPCVLKKRVSSRSKHNFLISTNKELSVQLRGKHIRDYVLQDVIEIEDDVRIVFLMGEFIGAVKRFTHTRAGNRLSVKGREVFSDIPSDVCKDAKKISSFLGADFVGFDVLFDKEGKFYFIEANLSPQFDKFEEATGRNLAEKLIRQVR